MLTRSVRSVARPALALLVLAACLSPALAGGFHIEVETPSPATAAQFKDAVLIVRAYGCHRPEDAKFTATAEGVIDGRRQSLPVELTAASKGVYAVRQQWPTEGHWVLAITSVYMGHTRSALVNIYPSGKAEKQGGASSIKGLPVRYVERKLTAAEIDEALQSPANGKRAEQRSEPSPLALQPATVSVAAVSALLAVGGVFTFLKRRRSALMRADNDR